MNLPAGVLVHVCGYRKAEQAVTGTLEDDRTVHIDVETAHYGQAGAQRGQNGGGGGRRPCPPAPVLW